VRRIEILDNLRLHFPEQDDEFDLGVEVGSLSVLMARGEAMIRRSVTEQCVEQLRPLAQGFRYALVATPGEEGMMDICLSSTAFGRPRFRVVSPTSPKSV